MNRTEAIQNLARHQAKLMGAWFLFYPGQSWIIFQPPPPVEEEPICRFPATWWKKQKEDLCQSFVATQHYIAS